MKGKARIVRAQVIQTLITHSDAPDVHFAHFAQLCIFCTILHILMRLMQRCTCYIDAPHAKDEPDTFEFKYELNFELQA